MTDSSVEAVARAIERIDADEKATIEHRKAEYGERFSSAQLVAIQGTHRQQRVGAMIVAETLAALPSPEREPLREALEEAHAFVVVHGPAAAFPDLIAKLNKARAALAPPTAQSEKAK